MLKVGFDMDGVLAHAADWLLARCQDRGYLRGRTVADISDHDWDKAFPGELPDGLITELVGSDGFASELAPCPWLCETTRRLAESGAQVHIVTARYPTPSMKAGTKQWLCRWQIPHVALHHCRPSQKAVYAAENGLHAFVEDKRETAIAMAKVCTSFLVAMPYNHVDQERFDVPQPLRWDREQFLRLPTFLS